MFCIIISQFYFHMSFCLCYYMIDWFSKMMRYYSSKRSSYLWALQVLQVFFHHFSVESLSLVFLSISFAFDRILLSWSIKYLTQVKIQLKLLDNFNHFGLLQSKGIRIHFLIWRLFCVGHGFKQNSPIVENAKLDYSKISVLNEWC